MGSSPWAESFEATSESASASLISALSRSLIAFGGPAGAKQPNHQVNS
jgi:hypothetical protein